MSCIKLSLSTQDKLLIKSTKIASDYWMIAEEAKEYGMIDEVLKRS
jgi:ATP-dependent protease ClpP protease subunit